MPLSLKIPAFETGKPIPPRFTCDGSDISPAVSWSDPPAGVKSFALLVEDPDAPVGVWNHWLLWDIPSSVSSLQEAFDPGTLGVSGRNDFGLRGYGGPCPPRGHGPHRYFFRLFALDWKSLGLPEGSSRQGFDNALEGHILDQAVSMGTYERK